MIVYINNRVRQSQKNRIEKDGSLGSNEELFPGLKKSRDLLRKTSHSKERVSGHVVSSINPQPSSTNRHSKLPQEAVALETEISKDSVQIRQVQPTNPPPTRPKKVPPKGPKNPHPAGPRSFRAPVSPPRVKRFSGSVQWTRDPPQPVRHNSDSLRYEETQSPAHVHGAHPPPYNGTNGVHASSRTWKNLHTDPESQTLRRTYKPLRHDPNHVSSGSSSNTFVANGHATATPRFDNDVPLTSSPLAATDIHGSRQYQTTIPRDASTTHTNSPESNGGIDRAAVYSSVDVRDSSQAIPEGKAGKSNIQDDMFSLRSEVTTSSGRAVSGRSSTNSRVQSTRCYACKDSRISTEQADRAESLETYVSCELCSRKYHTRCARGYEG